MSPTSHITACTMDCPDACSLIVDQDDQGKPRLRGNPLHPFTAGFTCAKIRKHFDRLNSPQRILHPLLRDGNSWRRISWDEALDRCAAAIDTLRGEPAAILPIQGDGAKGILKKVTPLFFDLLQSSRTRGSLCDAAGYLACIHDFGSRDNHDAHDLLNAQTIVNWGKDLTRTSIHMAAIVRRARKHGARHILISPGAENNRDGFDHFIRIRPGTDRFLAAAIILLLLDHGRIDAAVLQRTKNWTSFEKLLQKQTPADLCAACEVPLAQVEELYRVYAQPAPIATIIGTGLQRYRYGGENVRFINALALLSNNIGITGGGSYYHLHSLRNLEVSWARANRKKPRRTFKMAAIGAEILNAADPPVKLIWISGSNIVNQAPDSRQIIRAFQSVPFKVVVDAFMTDTARHADLILPATLMLEQEDIIASYLHDYVQYVCKLAPAPGEAKSDFRIMHLLAQRLKPPIDLPDKTTCFEKSLNSVFLDTSLDELRRCHTVRAQRPPVAYEGLQFDHPDGLYRFPIKLHTEPKAAENFNLRLLSLARRDAIHSQILPVADPVKPTVWVAPDCPALATLDRNREIYLVSPLGRLAVNLELMAGLYPQAVVYRRGDWIQSGGGINQLIQARPTDIGNGAPYYEQYVRLEN